MEYHELSVKLMDAWCKDSKNIGQVDKMIRNWLEDKIHTLRGRDILLRGGIDETRYILGLTQKPLAEKLKEAARYNGIPPTGMVRVANWEELVQIAKDHLTDEIMRELRPDYGR